MSSFSQLTLDIESWFGTTQILRVDYETLNIDIKLIERHLISSWLWDTWSQVDCETLDLKLIEKHRYQVNWETSISSWLRNIWDQVNWETFEIKLIEKHLRSSWLRDTWSQVNWETFDLKLIERHLISS